MKVKILGINIDPIKTIRERIHEVSNEDYLEVRKDIIEIMHEQDLKRGFKK